MNKDDAKRRLTVIEDEARALRKMIEEPDVVSLKHGDFGVWCNGQTKFIVDNSHNDLPHIHMLWRDMNCRNSWLRNDQILNRAIVYGNIFDIMKGWDKDFTGFNKEMHASGVDAIGTHVRLYACSGGHCTKVDSGIRWNVTQAKQYMNAIGHAIAHIKRQNA